MEEARSDGEEARSDQQDINSVGKRSRKGDDDGRIRKDKGSRSGAEKAENHAKVSVGAPDPPNQTSNILIRILVFILVFTHLIPNTSASGTQEVAQSNDCPPVHVRGVPVQCDSPEQFVNTSIYCECCMNPSHGTYCAFHFDVILTGQCGDAEKASKGTPLFENGARSDDHSKGYISDQGYFMYTCSNFQPFVCSFEHVNGPSCPLVNGVVLTQDHDGVCFNYPCLNNGTCAANGSTGSPNCACLEGYSGPNCQYEDKCLLNNPCQHNAKCVPTPSSNDYSCQCVDGWRGAHCEIDGVCFNYPCLNNGTCAANGSSGSPNCTCLEGYSGPNCQYEAAKTDCSSYIKGLWGLSVALALTLALGIMVPFILYKKGKWPFTGEPETATQNGIGSRSHPRSAPL